MNQYSPQSFDKINPNGSVTQGQLINPNGSVTNDVTVGASEVLCNLDPAAPLPPNQNGWAQPSRQRAVAFASLIDSRLGGL